jgi:flagellin-specific chaperone FliS
MEKILLNEINRNLSLMGVKKLLVENTIFTQFIDLLDDFFETSVKKVAGVAGEVEVAGIRVTNQTLNKLKNVISNPSLFDTLDDASKRILGRIASQSKDYVDDVYKKVFQELTKRLSIPEQEIYALILKETSPPINKSFMTVLQEMTGDADIFIPTVLFRKMRQKTADFNNNAFVEEIPKPPVTANDDLAGKLRNVDVDMGKLSPDLSQLKYQLASNKTIFNVVRTGINRSLIKFESDVLGEQEFIQTIYNDLLRTAKKLTRSMTVSDANVITTELRNTAQKIQRLNIINKELESSLEKLYDEIEAVLKTVNNTEVRDKIPEIMEKLRKSAPFNEDLSGLEKSYFWQFLNTTASQQSINAAVRAIKNAFTWKKAFFDDALELIDRGLGWLATSSPKKLGLVSKPGEIFSVYFKNQSRTSGLIELIRDLWIAQHVGIPATMALFYTVKNLVLLTFTEKGGTEYSGFAEALADAFGQAFVEDYENNNGEVTLGSFLAGASLHWPGAVYVYRYFNETEQGKNRLTLPDDVISEYIRAGLKKEEIQEIIDNSGSVEEAERLLRQKIKEPVKAPGEEDEIKPEEREKAKKSNY